MRTRQLEPGICRRSCGLRLSGVQEGESAFRDLGVDIGCCGRVRVLRSGDDLDDYAAEVPPIAGTLLAFRRCATSYHGHPPFVGERRVIQLNWVTDDAVAWRERIRHRLTARLKKLNPFG